MLSDGSFRSAELPASLAVSALRCAELMASHAPREFATAPDAMDALARVVFDKAPGNETALQCLLLVAKVARTACAWFACAS
jgi:hypothetical protein